MPNPYPTSVIFLPHCCNPRHATCNPHTAPMLCILFLGARMRALQMDPAHGDPQRFAQDCFYMISYATLLQAR